MWYLTLREKRGAIVLILMIVLVRIIYFGWPYLVDEEAIEIVEFEKIQLFINSDTKEQVEKPVEIGRPVRLKPQEQRKKIPVAQQKKPIRIGVNNSDSEEWMRIRGIGPVLSKRIVKFRDALGGFCTIDQVGETYGLPDSVFQEFRKYLFIDRPCLQFDVNQMEWKELVRHPYIDSRQANAILRYVENRGPVENLMDIKQLGIFDSMEWVRLVHYLKYP